MIGLMFLGLALLWLGLTVYLTIKVPRWLGLKNHASWLLRLLLVPLLLVGPFGDHIVGMRQFQKLCNEQTGLQIYSGAANAKRGTMRSVDIDDLKGFAIRINQQKREILDLDTLEVIARYNYFSTRGGKVVSSAHLFGIDHCSPSQANHADSEKHHNLINRLEMTFGEIK